MRLASLALYPLPRVTLTSFRRLLVSPLTPSIRPRMASNKYSKLPKVELHIHLDGACRLSTLMELSRQQKLGLSYDDPEKFKREVSLVEPAPSLREFLQVFHAVNSVLNNKQAYERVAYEYCETCARQNVVYVEMRGCPLNKDVSPDDFMDGFLSGLRRGERDFGVKSRAILCFMKNAPENAMNLVELAARYKSQGVVAVDIAGDELLPMDPRFVTAFKKAKEYGLHVTVHAAESGPASNVRQAIEELGAERIGHGYGVLEDEEVYRLARESGVHFEVCPTSSYYTNAKQPLNYHSAKRFAEDKVSFSINTDDPGVMNIELDGEYLVAEEKLELTEEQLQQTVICGAKAAFLPPDEKQELLKTVETKIAEYRKTT